MFPIPEIPSGLPVNLADLRIKAGVVLRLSMMQLAQPIGRLDGIVELKDGV